MMKDSPLISVVIPCHNNRETLARAIQSVARQTYPHWEIRCVDDGSDTDSSQMIRSLHDERIHYTYLSHRNANVARNYGIQHSRGDYIAMLDADDEWLETHLEESLRHLEQTQADGVYGSLVLRQGKHDDEYTTRNIAPGESAIDFLLSSGFGAQTSTLVTTARSARATLWDENLNRHQDYDFVVRFSRKFRWEAVLSPTVVYHADNSAPRQIDYNSCIRFIEQHKGRISPQIAEQYFEHMLLAAFGQGADPFVIDYYRKSYRDSRRTDGEDLRRLALQQLSRQGQDNGPGLFQGQMGTALFFFHYYRYTGDEWFEDLAEEIINRITEQIHSGLPANLANGLCGIGWGIEYLAQQQFIAGDTDYLLEEVDEKIMERDVRRIKDLTLETGLEGIARYALLRFTSPYSRHAFDDTYRHDLLEACRAHPGKAADELGNYLEYGVHRPYPFEEVLIPLIYHNRPLQPWQEGLKLLVI